MALHLCHAPLSISFGTLIQDIQMLTNDFTKRGEIFIIPPNIYSPMILAKYLGII